MLATSVAIPPLHSSPMHMVRALESVHASIRFHLSITRPLIRMVSAATNITHRHLPRLHPHHHRLFRHFRAHLLLHLLHFRLRHRPILLRGLAAAQRARCLWVASGAFQIFSTASTPRQMPRAKECPSTATDWEGTSRCTTASRMSRSGLLETSRFWTAMQITCMATRYSAMRATPTLDLRPTGIKRPTTSTACLWFSETASALRISWCTT